MDTEQRVVLEGRIDSRTAPAYRDALACAIAEGVGALSVDLSRACLLYTSDAADE